MLGVLETKANDSQEFMEKRYIIEILRGLTTKANRLCELIPLTRHLISIQFRE